MPQARALLQKGEYAASLKSILLSVEILQNPAYEKNAYVFGNMSPSEFRLNRLAWAHQIYGDLMNETGNTEQAISHYKESLKIASLNKNYFRLANVSASIASQYYDADQLDSVEVYAKKSMNFFDQINIKINKSRPLLLLANKNFKAKNDKLGRKYLYQALQFATENKNGQHSTVLLLVCRFPVVNLFSGGI